MYNVHTERSEKTVAHDDQDDQHSPHIARRDGRSWFNFSLEVPTLFLRIVTVRCKLRAALRKLFQFLYKLVQLVKSKLMTNNNGGVDQHRQ